MCVIAVAPAAPGWRLRVDGLANDMMFRSGREAENAARRLASRLAAGGVRSEVRIHLLDGSLAGRFVCPAEWAAPLARAA